MCVFTKSQLNSKLFICRITPVAFNASAKVNIPWLGIQMAAVTGC